MLERMPDRYLNARTARAITSPSAIVLAGAGAAAAIVAGLPVAAVVGAGALGWATRVAFALPRRRVRSDRIDPFVLGEPWRRFVNEALQAQRRFDRAVAKTDVGPLKERLSEIASRIGAGVRECWRVAQRGDAIEDGLAALDIERTKAELIGVERDLRRGADPRLDAARTALRAQLHAAQRMIDAVQDARTQLRLLDARLDEAVTRAIELSLRSGADADVAGLGSDVESLVSDMEALRAALEDVEAVGGTTATT